VVGSTVLVALLVGVVLGVFVTKTWNWCSMACMNFSLMQWMKMRQQCFSIHVQYEFLSYAKNVNVAAMYFICIFEGKIHRKWHDISIWEKDLSRKSQNDDMIYPYEGKISLENHRMMTYDISNSASCILIYSIYLHLAQYFVEHFYLSRERNIKLVPLPFSSVFCRAVLSYTATSLHLHTTP
jgi:hypothetical protein